MPVPYDFNAGDTLVSTLQQAISNLQGFMSYRSSQAYANLLYHDNRGVGQGWIGKAYDDWARQFRQSQDVLNGYVYELEQHRVNTNNSLYDTELRIYKRTQRRLLSFPSLPAQPPYAPDNTNTALNGVEGANPDCLYTYSKNTTSSSNKFSNDNLRPFFAKDLPNAAYASPTDGTAPGHPSVPELAQSITRFLRFSVLELDARVAAVGEEFEAAGEGNAQQFYKFSSEQALFNAAQFAGQQAANTVRNLRLKTAGNPTPQEYSALLQQIAANQDDPAWTSAFFNSLSQQDLATLLHIMKTQEEPGRQAFAAALAQSYVTALSSGQLSPTAISMLIDNFLGGDSYVGDIGDFNIDFLNDLQDNAQAAALFFTVASNDQLLQMLNGGYSTPGQNASQREAQIITLFSSIVANDPDTANPGFYDRIIPLIFQTQPDPAGPVLAAAQVFLSQYIMALFPPPPSGDPSELTSWAESAGKWVQYLENTDPKGNWHGWIQHFEEANHQKTSQEQSEFENSFGGGISILELVVAGLQPELIPPAVALAASVGSGALSDWLAEKIYPGTFDGNPDTDPETMDSSAKYTTEFMVVFDLVASGRVTGIDGKQVTFTTSTDLVTVLDNPDQYMVGNVPLSNFMHDAGDEINPPQQPPPGLKMPGD